MGILNKLFEKKQEQKDFWLKTEFGFAPKDCITKDYSREARAYGSLGKGLVISELSKEYHELKSYESQTYEMTLFLNGKCNNCKSIFLIPDYQKPIFFKCPFCAPKIEKKLINYLLNLNPNNESFNQCPNCGEYVFLKVEDLPTIIKFHCTKCNNNHILNKDHEIKISDYYPSNNYLLWCQACGILFESSIRDKIIKCPHCNSYGKIYRGGSKNG